MRELGLRILSAAFGYVSLLFMLRSPEPIRTFALYLPSSILFTLAVDFGRAEMALRQGLSAAAMRRIVCEAGAFAALSVVFFGLLPFAGLSTRSTVVAALLTTGVLQAYVDIVLRLFLFRYRRSLHVFLFQSALAFANLFVATAIAFGLIVPIAGLGLFVFLPLGAVIVLVVVLGRRNVSDRLEPVHGTSLGTALAALVYRSFPPAAYTAYAASLSGLAPDMASAARAFYFVFGFVHLRTMARESTVASVGRMVVLLFAVTVAVWIPIQVFAPGQHPITWSSAAVGGGLTALSSVAFSYFLHRYARFVNESRWRA